MKGKKIVKTKYILELNSRELKDIRRIVEVYGINVKIDQDILKRSVELFSVLDDTDNWKEDTK